MALLQINSLRLPLLGSFLWLSLSLLLKAPQGPLQVLLGMDTPLVEILCFECHLEYFLSVI